VAAEAVAVLILRAVMVLLAVVEPEEPVVQALRLPSLAVR
jgi:hypothetical protein